MVYSLEFYLVALTSFTVAILPILEKISFGIYLWYVPAGMGIKRIYPYLWRTTHLSNGNLAKFLVFIVTTFIVTAGDCFAIIEDKVVKFARWTQGKLFISWP